MKALALSINQWCKKCGICSSFCPAQALAWEKEEKPRWIMENCVGCKKCELICPDLAITLEVKKDAQ